MSHREFELEHIRQLTIRESVRFNNSQFINANCTNSQWPQSTGVGEDFIIILFWETLTRPTHNLSHKHLIKERIMERRLLIRRWWILVVDIGLWTAAAANKNRSSTADMLLQGITTTSWGCGGGWRWRDAQKLICNSAQELCRVRRPLH